jgi:CelD/BcsL family acetyltransferase involved in cellulose biosynthesis
MRDGESVTPHSRRVVELVPGLEAIQGLRSDWNALYARAESPFLSQGFEWNWCAFQTLVAPAGAKAVCMAVWQDGRLCLAWPLAIKRHHRFWRLARAPASSECADPLIEARDDAFELADAACRGLWAAGVADLFYIDFIRAASALDRALQGRRPYWTRQVESFSAGWHHHTSWDDYVASLPKGLRSQMAGRERRLSARGELRFEVVQDERDRAQVIAWILDQKRRWLDVKRRTSDFVGAPGYVEFLTSAAREVRCCGSVVVFRLSLNDEILAAEYHLLNATRLDYIVGAYSPDHEKDSPGHILRRHALEWAFQNRKVYNFGPGRDRYKEAFSNDVAGFTDLRLASSLRGRLFVTFWKLRGKEPEAS